MIEYPPVCLVGDTWFIGSRRSDDTGKWLYRMVGGVDEDWSVGEITQLHGAVTWFHLVENDLIDMEAPL